MLADKDVAGIVEPLARLVDSWTAVPVEGSRAEPAAVLARKIANCSIKPCRIATSIPEALDFAESRAPADEMTLVTGSFYAVGPALEWLQQEQ
jgi:dihydrofolate synthase/folylpolyglutamate synthase